MSNVASDSIQEIGDFIAKSDDTRINLANGRNRFTPLRRIGNPVSAGIQHIIEGHFNRLVGNSRSIFSISVDYLKEVLYEKIWCQHRL